ncbi:MAG: hypothetical protein WCX64_01570 [Candidatus Micrarchaeia archaeon]|jgi:uncharacterized protein YoxC
MEILGMSAIAFGLFTISMVILAVVIYFVIDYQRRTQKEIKELSSRLEQLEREYLKMKPEIESMRTGLEELVDYPTMEKKLRDLISFVGEKMKTKR